MRLAVVTVNYCCAAEILDRLESTASQIAASGGEWWIVDNKSPDNSAQILSSSIKKLTKVHLIEAERNGGFGFGNNQVINKILSGEFDAQYIYFLNPDASPEPGAIETMLSYLDEHPEVGLVGSGLINEDGTHTDSMFRFPCFWSEIESTLAFGPVSRLLKAYRTSLGEMDRAGPVDWVAGTSFVIRPEVLRAAGGFDEDFFLYWEEVELCHRVAKAGFSIHGVPSAKVRHVGGVSTGMHRRENRLPAYWHQSRNLYFQKTGTGGPLTVLNVATVVSIALSRFLELLKGRGFRHPRLLRDHIRHAFSARRHQGRTS